MNKKLMAKELVKIADELGGEKAVIKKISKYVFDNYNIYLNLDVPVVGKYNTAQKVKIDTGVKSIGALSPVFEYIEVDCKFGSYNEGDGLNYVLLLDYKWHHPRGSNGYSIRMMFDGNGKFVSIVN